MFKSKIQNPKSKINPKSKCQISKSGFVHLSFVLCHSFVICALSFAILTNGCALITETAKGIAGVSTKVLEDNRKSAITRSFNYDYFSCYTQTLDILKRTYAYIYVQDIRKHMIAVYVSEYDTTPVGLFFKEIDANHTQIEVSSPSTYAKEFIADNIASVLEKEITLGELEEQLRAKKQKEAKAQEDLANR
jgi:hypothetical protein